MALSAPPGWVYTIERMWLLAPLLKVLERRRRELALLQQLSECVQSLWRNPRSPGLNVEQVRMAGHHAVLSARVTLQFRLIMVQLAAREVGLLYLDNHDEAYAWVDRNLDRIPTMLARVQEVPRGGGSPPGPLVPVVRAGEEDPIAVASAQEFTRMLAGGVERYLAYLDGEQRQLADASTRGLLLVKGGAGTGKTAVAVHRVASFLRQPDLIEPRPVLFLCFNRVLAQVVGQLLDAIFGGRRPEGVEITTLHNWCVSYLVTRGLSFEIADSEDPGERIGTGGRLWRVGDHACEQLLYRHVWPKLPEEVRAGLEGVSPALIRDEITRVVKGNDLATLQEYLEFNRQGRRFGLKQRAREAVWAVYERLRQAQEMRGVLQWHDVPRLALRALESDADFRPYRAVVVDEGQDFSPAMLRLARRLAGGPDGQLTVLADPTQDIYESGFRWAQRELRTKGGSVRWLRRSYRNTAETFALARLAVEPCDEVREDLDQIRAPDRSGPRPTLVVAAKVAEEVEEVCRRVVEDLREVPPECIALLSPSHEGLAPFHHRLGELGVPVSLLAHRGDLSLAESAVKLLTVASAKGLDFPVVYLVRITRQGFGGVARAGEPATRKALYMALTRASQKLVVSTVMGQHHPLLEELADDRYDAAGSCGQTFVNLRGFSG